MPKAIAIPLTEIRTEALSWLWPGYIPRGKLTLLDGDPGLGKSLLTIDLAARLSTGRPMPDGTDGGPVGHTLILQAEDGTANTLLPRLAAAGADIRQVSILAHADGRPVHLPRNFPSLARAIRASETRLVVIDPLIAFLSPSVWMSSDQSVRQVLDRLSRIAEQTGAAVVMVRHLNKKGDQKALYRGSGSIGIVGAARAGLLVATDPREPARRVLTTTKTNFGPCPPALTYRITATEGGTAVVTWEGPVALTADAALRPVPEPDDGPPPLGVIEATDWLMKTLKDGPMTAVEVYQQAVAAGISERTLERAKKPAAVESSRRQDKATGQYRWLWRLRKQWDWSKGEFPPIPGFGEDDEGW